jgi:hypothetical protein
VSLSWTQEIRRYKCYIQLCAILRDTRISRKTRSPCVGSTRYSHFIPRSVEDESEFMEIHLVDSAKKLVNTMMLQLGQVRPPGSRHLLPNREKNSWSSADSLWRHGSRGEVKIL